MRIDPEQHMVIIKSREAWIAQARDALAAITEANGGQAPAAIGPDTASYAPVPFGQLVEAMAALEQVGGPHVADDWVKAAGLVPVDQALMGDD